MEECGGGGVGVVVVCVSACMYDELSVGVCLCVCVCGRRFVVQVRFPNDVARLLIFLWQAAPGKENQCYRLLQAATGSELHGRPLFFWSGRKLSRVQWRDNQCMRKVPVACRQCK